MKSTIKSVINLMVSSSTLEFTKNNSYNCKTMVALPLQATIEQKKTNQKGEESLNGE
jgi:hypothetical protein